MTCRFRRSLLACLVFLGLFASATFAQETEPAQEMWTGHDRIFGAALMINYPYESFGDSYNTGYGLHAILDYPFIPLLDITADIGWNHFPVAGDGSSVDVWEFAGGLRLVMGAFFMSGEVGYYTEVDDTSFLPGLGLRFEHLEIALRVKAVTGGSWTSLRIGYYF